MIDLARFIAAMLLVSTLGQVDPPEALARLRHAQAFHAQSQARCGLLVPMYVYPGDVDANAHWRRLLDAKRSHETVPFWVVVNPASGPGEQVDPNYTRAIARLRGAGCVVLGYVTTSYGKRAPEEITREIDRWLALYPGIHGVFYDEMRNEDTEAAVRYQADLTRHARDAGLWPAVANPGTDVPERYFAAGAADVIVIHEGDAWPAEDRLRGNATTGYTDHPPWTRAVLVHSQIILDHEALRRVRRHARWIYATEAPYRPGDPSAANPWDRASAFLDDLAGAVDDR